VKLRNLLIELSVMLAVGIALAALGPFGTFSLGPFAVRLAYWVPAALIGYLLYRPVMIAADTLAARLGFSRMSAQLVGIAVASAPATLFILWWNGNRFAALPSFERCFQLYVQVALIGALVSAIFLVIEALGARSVSERSGQPIPVAQSPRPAAPRFFDRLPPAFTGQLVALEMEDHYVRAHWRGGSALILVRLRDAVAELDGLDGLQVHRSWWVAASAVAGIARDGRKYGLELVGGTEAPVARDRVDSLRAAGWLRR
jgi:DNA-binding LytR/AlgR family response regulator